MAKYKLDTGLWTTQAEEHPNDKEAWEALRKKLPHKFATLYKLVEFDVKINNEESYVKVYNAKYGPKPIGYGPDNAKLLVVGEKNIGTAWVPILNGVTSDEYNVK